MRNHKKVKALRAKFGQVLGYAFWSMIIEYLTEQDGIELENSDLEIEMFAGELGISATEIRDMVNYCIKIELLFIDNTNHIFSKNLKCYLRKRLTHANKRMYTYNIKKWYLIIKEVFKRDNYICQYCGSVGGKLEADHIIPFSKGGKDSLENLTTSCRKCNRQKRDKSVEEFKIWRKTHGTTK
jgi:hypothetical protein